MVELECNNVSLASKVVAGGFCIGCGGCAVRDSENTMSVNDMGMPVAMIATDSLVDDICPFSAVQDEDVIASKLFSEGTVYDDQIGYYLANYVGSVSEGEYRKNASSGGLTTWVLAELFALGEIDGVIHVAANTSSESLFEYTVSDSSESIVNNSKSRYYPVHFDKALNSILGNGKRYAFVGVPCFVKTIRLLSEEEEAVRDSIKYCFSIFCGHAKTKAYTEMLSMQHGIASKDITSVDYRVKSDSNPANKYAIRISHVDENSVSSVQTPTTKLYGLDWGLGYFKPKACDWCDDIAGETADMACGDAWLPEVVSDSRGTNIVVVRNTKIKSILDAGLKSGRLDLYEVGPEKVYESQAGNFRHRREGLSVRVKDSETGTGWRPRKRIRADSYFVSPERAEIYRVREEISAKSHLAFIDARERKSFLLFIFKMLPLELKYYALNKRLIKASVLIFYQVMNFIFRRNIK